MVEFRLRVTASISPYKCIAIIIMCKLRINSVEIPKSDPANFFLQVNQWKPSSKKRFCLPPTVEVWGASTKTGGSSAAVEPKPARNTTMRHNVRHTVVIANIFVPLPDLLQLQSCFDQLQFQLTQFKKLVTIDRTLWINYLLTVVADSCSIDELQTKYHSI